MRGRCAASYNLAFAVWTECGTAWLSKLPVLTHFLCFSPSDSLLSKAKVNCRGRYRLWPACDEVKTRVPASLYRIRYWAFPDAAAADKHDIQTSSTTLLTQMSCPGLHRARGSLASIASYSLHGNITWLNCFYWRVFYPQNRRKSVRVNGQWLYISSLLQCRLVTKVIETLWRKLRASRRHVSNPVSHTDVDRTWEWKVLTKLSLWHKIKLNIFNWA